MKNYFSSLICAFALFGLTFLPTVARADGFQVWVFWCGESIIINIDEEQEFFDDQLYTDLEELFCGEFPGIG